MTVIVHHAKYLKRLATTFIKKSREEGKQAAEEWAARTLTPELIEQVAKVLQGSK